MNEAKNDSYEETYTTAKKLYVGSLSLLTTMVVTIPLSVEFLSPEIQDIRLRVIVALALLGMLGQASALIIIIGNYVYDVFKKNLDT